MDWYTTDNLLKTNLRVYSSKKNNLSVARYVFELLLNDYRKFIARITNWFIAKYII